MSEHTSEKRIRVYAEVLLHVREAFPNAFPRIGVRPPLRISIFDDLLKTAPHLSRTRLRIFLGVWTRSTAYLKGAARAQFRIDLLGAPCEPMLPAHRAEARRRLTVRQGFTRPVRRKTGWLGRRKPRFLKERVQ